MICWSAAYGLIIRRKNTRRLRAITCRINRGFNVLFVYAEDPDSIEDMIKLLREEILVGLPDTNAFSVQGSLFNFGFGSGRELNLDFQGPDVPQLMQQAADCYAKNRNNYCLALQCGLCLIWPWLSLSCV